IAKDCAHLRVALQMTLGVLGEKFSDEIEVGVLSNTDKNIQDLASVWFGVLHAIGRDQGHAKFRSEINQRAINPIFASQKMPLNFNIDILATERINQTLRAV